MSTIKIYDNEEGRFKELNENDANDLALAKHVYEILKNQCNKNKGDNIDMNNNSLDDKERRLSDYIGKNNYTGKNIFPTKPSDPLNIKGVFYETEIPDSNIQYMELNEMIDFIKFNADKLIKFKMLRFNSLKVSGVSVELELLENKNIIVRMNGSIGLEDIKFAPVILPEYVTMNEAMPKLAIDIINNDKPLGFKAIFKDKDDRDVEYLNKLIDLDKVYQMDELLMKILIEAGSVSKYNAIMECLRVLEIR